jgi:hypothetical protein
MGVPDSSIPDLFQASMHLAEAQRRLVRARSQVAPGGGNQRFLCGWPALPATWCWPSIGSNGVADPALPRPR